MEEVAPPPDIDGPPPLPYTLWTRKKSITYFWSLFVIDTLIQPLVLYFTLRYATPLSLNLVFTISTGALGGVSVFEYLYRLYHLLRKSLKSRPLNARKSWLDFFQINFTIVWLILAAILIYGTVQTYPPVRLLAMPLPAVMYYFGAVHLTLDVLRMMGFTAPFRISSTPRGSVMPTALYVLIEDIVAVDGGGGQSYRYALRCRYLSSPYFRRMLFRMNCFWAGGALVAAAVITVLIFTTPTNVAYTLGWSLPFAWAITWICITIPWVQAELRQEKATWHTVRHYGQPYTDDISAMPHTTTPSRLFGVIREPASSPSSSANADGANGTEETDQAPPVAGPAQTQESPGHDNLDSDAKDEKWSTE